MTDTKEGSDKIGPTKIETEMDKRLSTKEVKKQIHDLYEKYYGSGL
jgi:hypothetical protein